MNRFLPVFRTALLSAALLGAGAAYGKDFVIYDRMDYVGKPDLTDAKLSKVFLIYETELVMPDPTGQRKHGVLNEKRIRELAQQSYREGYRTISTDIESWFHEKDGQLLSPETLKQDFARMYQIFREENPHAYISNYSLPNEHLHSIRFYRPQQSNDEILAKWQQSGKRRHSSAAISDYASPVFYIATPDMKQWEQDVETMVADIKQRYPQQKIIAYLWPQYYSASGSPHFKQFVDAERWRKMLEVSYRHADGVIIWSDKRDEHGKIVRWEDPRVQSIMQATQAFIAKHPHKIAVESLQKPALDFYLNKP